MTEPVVSMLPEELDKPVELDEPVETGEPVGLDESVETDDPDAVTVVPDRADAPVSVITERFLKTVVEHVPLDRIEELHLFSPLRQGGVETGIAVIAARVPVPGVSLFNNSELPLDNRAEASAQPVRERHTVYTARYRLVQKGPERGKWEADVVAEADAPLITVETVVRGVQRRAGEESEILRFTAKQIAHAVNVPWPLPVEATAELVAEPVAEPVSELPIEQVEEPMGEPDAERGAEPEIDIEAT